MRVVILAGGRQSTLSNTGEGIPKPMVELGGRPTRVQKHRLLYRKVAEHRKIWKCIKNFGLIG